MSSNNSEILNRVIEIEKQWLQCQLIYSIVTRCIPLNAILLADPTSSHVNCQELLHTIDTYCSRVCDTTDGVNTGYCSI